MNEDQMITIDEEEAAQYIQNNLFGNEGIYVAADDIKKIVDYYYDFLESKGLYDSSDGEEE